MCVCVCVCVCVNIPVVPVPDHMTATIPTYVIISEFYKVLHMTWQEAFSAPSPASFLSVLYSV